MPSQTEIVRDILEAARVWKETGRMSELPLDARGFDATLVGKMDRIDEASDGMGHEFVTALSMMAGAADTVVDGPNGETGTIRDLFLFPVVGSARAVSSLTTDDLEWLRSSFHRFGLLAPDSQSRLFPLPIPGRLLARIGPGFLSRVSRSIAEAIQADMEVASTDGPSASDAMMDILLRSMKGQAPSEEDEGETVERVFVGMRWATFPLSEFPTRRGDLLRTLPTDDVDPVPPGTRERWNAEAAVRFAGRETFMTSLPAGWYPATAAIALMRLQNDFAILRAHWNIPREATVADEVIGHYGEEVVLVALRHGETILGPCSVPLDMTLLDRRLFAHGIRGMGHAWSSRDTAEEMRDLTSKALN